MKFSIYLSIALTLLFSSCTKECDYWMDGKKCEVEVRTRYYGDYIGTMTVMVPTQGNLVNTRIVYSPVKAGNEGQKSILIDGFKSQLIEENKFDIPFQQVFFDGVSSTAQGEGTFSDNHIIYNMVIAQGQTTLLVNFVGTK